MLTYPQIDPVALAIGPLKIHWYGLMYLIGIGGAWLLASRHNSQGEPLLLANEMSQNATNLSFEREFGAIIGRLDLIANLLGENSRRIGINYAQGLLLFNFLPVR